MLGSGGSGVGVRTAVVRRKLNRTRALQLELELDWHDAGHAGAAYNSGMGLYIAQGAGATLERFNDRGSVSQGGESVCSVVGRKGFADRARSGKTVQARRRGVGVQTDFTPQQWEIIDKLIRLWDLTVVAPPPKASYLIPNGENLARVDEYDIGSRATIPVVRDIVHSDRCLLDLNQNFLRLSPLDYDCIFVGTKQQDSTPAMSQPLKEAISQIGTLTAVAPLFYWSEEQVEEASKGLPYSKEWYEDGDENFDTGNLLACSRCVRSGTGEPVDCPKEGKMVIRRVIWISKRC